MMESAASIRSLSSLQLVPPPKKSQGVSDRSLLAELAEWDPFPAPYAPHAEGRDEEENESPDDRCARDDAEPMRDADAPSKTTDSKGGRPPISAHTPPRVPRPRKADLEAYPHSSDRRRSRSRNPRSSTPSKNGEDEELIKITADGRVSNDSGKKKRRSRYRSFSPMLTRGRVNEHDKETDVKRDYRRSESSPAKTCNEGSQETSSAKPAPASGVANITPSVFMVGTSRVYSRSLIPPTIYHNPATDNWIVTINTSSKLASAVTSTQSNNNALKAFSFRTEKEARASAYANAPPVMIPFDTCKECMLCETKFTPFKRPRHCRNCGICICSNFGCSTTWSKTMIPETFNTKRQSTVKVCTSCHSLTRRFKHALLNGRYGTAVELFLTGNINLRVPFVSKDRHKETLYPIHCAIEGRSEKLLRWLVDVQHCPLHVISTGNTNKSSSGVTSSVVNAGADLIKSLNESLVGKEKKHQYTPTIKTSKGRSVIDIAMKAQHVGLLRYLINEKNVSVYEVEELELALGAVEALAKAFPAVDGSYDPDMFEDKEKVDNGSSNEMNACSSGVLEKRSDGGNRGKDGTKSARKTKQKSINADTSPKKEKIYSHSISISPPNKKEKSLLPRDISNRGLYGAIGGYDGNNEDSECDDDEDVTIVLEDDCSVVSTTVPETCIMCRERHVDCVATPCGHQMCCLACSNQLLRCPTCDLECHFIETYQP